MSWKDKILDYEIETQNHKYTESHAVYLKRQDTRLRDWNYSGTFRIQFETELEKTRYSITRLKQHTIERQPHQNGDLKRQDTRLRDWNGVIGYPATLRLALKRQDTRLRDWNFAYGLPRQPVPLAWKDKILDYEIETRWYGDGSGSRAFLEKTRYSITRLKPYGVVSLRQVLCHLEKTRYSITRLKRSSTSCASIAAISWKDKILDYEIETISFYPCLPTTAGLKRQDTRLRDWNPLDFFLPPFYNIPMSWSKQILDYEIETW